MNENLTQFVKALLIKISEIFDLSKFVRLFHRQSFALYGIRFPFQAFRKRCGQAVII